MHADLSIEIKIGRFIFDSRFTRNFGPARPKPNRMVWLMGLRTGQPDYRNWSVMIQIYRPGMELDWHEDGYGIHNFVWSWVFWKPRVGGDLIVDGPHQKWWRFYRFDGGVTRHMVTRCGGYRGVIMFQHGRKIKKENRQNEKLEEKNSLSS